mmetsp:Transcript_45104/g.107235  ORF Transcript_45104/g.107235 Transcript_45104/m.107235 type:complete len:222 (+) Transcript_45104:89-754(+)
MYSLCKCGASCNRTLSNGALQKCLLTQGADTCTRLPHAQQLPISLTGRPLHAALPARETTRDDLWHILCDRTPLMIFDPTVDHLSNVLSTLWQRPNQSLHEASPLHRQGQVPDNPREDHTPDLLLVHWQDWHMLHGIPQQSVGILVFLPPWQEGLGLFIHLKTGLSSEGLNSLGLVLGPNLLHDADLNVKVEGAAVCHQQVLLFPLKVLLEIWDVGLQTAH